MMAIGQHDIKHIDTIANTMLDTCLMAQYITMWFPSNNWISNDQPYLSPRFV